MSFMFGFATEAQPNVTKWNVEKVTDMNSMFYYAKNAKPDTSLWKLKKDCYTTAYLTDLECQNRTKQKKN